MCASVIVIFMMINKALFCYCLMHGSDKNNCLSLSPFLSLFLSLPSIKKSLHPNIQDELGYTLLHHATLNSQRETVSFLIRNGASTTIPDSSGGCVLHY